MSFRRVELELFMNRWTTSKTVRVAAKVGQHDIKVLIDSGSTHKKIANLLQLPVVPTEPFDVRVANGSPLKCKGRFDHVQILLQCIPFSLTFYSLPLTGLDLVLGLQWLEQLGTVVCNWKKMTMEFQWHNQFQMLQGINTRPIQAASLRVISKEVRQGSSMFAVCL
ncbi:hypothetical protein Pint_26952 [Pistacia integerrima]|uniref:Uncharacterized protein n=1 Tax=Pistacia integerrima TaxID=434235 RepID=A0ACC0YTN1_9ROSI|nr:hypothetical protein Pint_26952 [Pistacia integerrima]